jgi:hypothetical protein
VTLVATPSAGAKLASWSGACGGSAQTCEVLMNAAKNVRAQFAGGAARLDLTLRVVGRGTVSASQGACSSGGGTKTCKQTYVPGSSTLLTAKPRQGESFLGWRGACSGKKLACTLLFTQARAVTATFSGGSTTTLTSAGSPTIAPTRSGYVVTLHVRAARPGTARVRALRAGRAVTTLRFRIPAGNERITFPLEDPGFYAFEISVLGPGAEPQVLRWHACLGTCGAAAPASAGRFVLTSQPLLIKRAGGSWLVTVRFRETQPAAVKVQVFRGGTLVAEPEFATDAGKVELGPLALPPGEYRIRVTAVDGFGRIRVLTFAASLAA